MDMDCGTWQSVRAAERWWSAEAGDSLQCMREMPDNSVDMVLTSPPYEDARFYNIAFKLRGQAWVDWAVPFYLECVRVCRGMVFWVVEGRTRNFVWSGTPFLFGADLIRAGVKLRKPPAMCRVGIAGSGGPDFLRNDYEFVVCSSKGKMPWSDNTACGHPPKWAPGGEMSYRLSDGTRRNQWGKGEKGGNGREQDGSFKHQDRPSHEFSTVGEARGWAPRGGPGHGGGDIANAKEYKPPKIANPGNLIKVKVGGGVMGDALCHTNEAPFAEQFAEQMIRPFCPPGGIVLDPFVGSGTALAVAVKFMRRAIGFDIRESQILTCSRRVPKMATLLHPDALEVIRAGGMPDCPGKRTPVGAPGGEPAGGGTGDGASLDQAGPAADGAGDDGQPAGQKNPKKRPVRVRKKKQAADRDLHGGLPDAPDGGAAADGEHPVGSAA